MEDTNLSLVELEAKLSSLDLNSDEWADAVSSMIAAQKAAVKGSVWFSDRLSRAVRAVIKRRGA